MPCSLNEELGWTQAQRDEWREAEIDSRSERGVAYMVDPYTRDIEEVDIRIRPLLCALWEAGAYTNACCSGHYHIHRVCGELVSGHSEPYIMLRRHKRIARELIKFMAGKGYQFSLNSVYGWTAVEWNTAVRLPLHNPLRKQDLFPRFENDVLAFLNEAPAIIRKKEEAWHPDLLKKRI